MATPSKSAHIKFSPEQEQTIREHWDRLDLLTLTQRVFNDPNLNGHNAEARAVKKWIVDNVDPDAKIKTSKDAKGLPFIDKDARTLIKNNPDTKPLELAKLIWPNINITFASNEYRAVCNALVEINPCYIAPEDKLVSDVEYKPVTSIARLIPRVNTYVMSKEKENKKFLDAENIKPDELRNLTALLTYIRSYRYIQQQNRFVKDIDRELMESQYISFTYDKPDLLPEELDSYISLCAEIVNCSQLDRMIQLYNDKIHENLTEEGAKKLNYADLDQVAKMRESLKESKKHVEKLKEGLVGARNERQDQRKQENATMLHLLEAFKHEESRKQLAVIAQKQRTLEALEVDELASMDDVVGLIAGFGKNRAKFG